MARCFHLSYFYYLFHAMESDSVLDPDSAEDLLALHFVFYLWYSNRWILSERVGVNIGYAQNTIIPHISYG